MWLLLLVGVAAVVRSESLDSNTPFGECTDPAFSEITLNSVRVFSTCQRSEADPGFGLLPIAGLGTGEGEFDCVETDPDPRNNGYVALEFDVVVPVNPSGAECDITFKPMALAQVSLGGIEFVDDIRLTTRMYNKVLRYGLDPIQILPAAYRRLVGDRDDTSDLCDYSEALCLADLYSVECEDLGAQVRCLNGSAAAQYECVGEARRSLDIGGMTETCFDGAIVSNDTFVPGTDVLEARYIHDRFEQEVSCRFLQCGPCPQEFTEPHRRFLPLGPGDMRVDPDVAQIATVNDTERFRVPGEYDAWMFQTEADGWGFLRLDVDETPLLVYDLRVNGANVEGRRAGEGCDGGGFDSWEPTQVCTTANVDDAPQRDCNCADFPGWMPVRTWLTRDENDDFVADEEVSFVGAPTIGGSIVVEADLSVTGFGNTGPGNTSDAVVFVSDYRWERQVQTVVPECDDCGGSRGYCVCSEEKVPRSPADLSNDPVENYPQTWFHGFRDRRRLRLGFGPHEWGSHPGSLANTYEDAEQTFPQGVLFNGAQTACRGRVGTHVPGVDFWSVELGDASRYPDQPECAFDENGNVDIANCPTTSIGLGSSLSMRQFLDSVNVTAASNQRSVHLPPGTFLSELGLVSPDAWLGRATVQGDRSWSKIFDDPDNAPYLFVDSENRPVQAAIQRYTARIGAKTLRYMAAPSDASVNMRMDDTPDCVENGTTVDPMFEGLGIIRVQVCNESPFPAAFDLALDCGLYATPLVRRMLTQNLTAAGTDDLTRCDNMVRFFFTPIVGTRATIAACRVRVFNNVGQELINRAYTAVCEDSDIVPTPAPSPTPEPPPTPMTPTPSLPPTPEPAPTPATTSPTTPPGTTSPEDADSSSSDTALILAGVVGGVLLCLILASFLIKDPTPEEKADKIDDAIKDATIPASVSIPAQPTPGLVESLQRQSELARLARSAASAVRRRLPLRRR